MTGKELIGGLLVLIIIIIIAAFLTGLIFGLFPVVWR